MKEVRHALFLCGLVVLGPSPGCGGPPDGTPTPTRPGAGAALSLSEADIRMSRLTDPEDEVRSGKVKLRFTLAAAGYDLKDVHVAVIVSNELFKGKEETLPPSFRVVGVTKGWGGWQRSETKDVEISSRLGDRLQIVSLQGRARAVPPRPDGPAAEAECSLDASWAGR